MKLTDEAVEAAWRSWNGMHVGTAHDRLRAALEAAAPHLTDDGAAAPPAEQTGQQVLQHLGSGSAAESATTTAAPSSPHRYRLAWLSARRRAGYASKAFFAEAAAANELESERISWHRKEGYEAGIAVVREGATPADSGLREAVNQLRMYCGLCIDEPNASEDEQVAYDDIAIRLAKILRDHLAGGVS